MRKSQKLKDIVREFNDRGTQWVLESPENLRGLMLVAAGDLAEHLDFDHAEQISTRFIPDNLRKQEADLLFKIPYRSEDGAEPKERQPKAYHKVTKKRTQRHKKNIRNQPENVLHENDDLSSFCSCFSC